MGAWCVTHTVLVYAQDSVAVVNFTEENTSIERGLAHKGSLEMGFLFVLEQLSPHFASVPKSTAAEKYWARIQIN